MRGSIEEGGLKDGLPVGEVVDLLGSAVERILQVDQLPEIVRLHVFGLRRAHLHFSHRNQHLVADDLHFRRRALGRHTLR